MKFFVYGTLRDGMYNYDLYLKGKVKKKQRAYVKGTLYSLKGKVYPALLEGDRWIVGDLFEAEDNQELLEQLDQLESFYGEGCIDNEYNRINKLVVDENYEEIGECPIYFYNIKNPKLRETLGEIIEENDYCLYQLNKKC